MNPENNDIVVSQEKPIYQKLLQVFLVATMFLLPAFFLPATLLNLYSVKLAVFATLGLASLLVWLASLLLNGTFSFPKEKMLLPFVLLPVIALFSALFNGNFVKSFVGTIFEINTVAFLLLGVLFALVTLITVKKEQTLFHSITAFVLGACLVLLVIILKIIASYGLLPAFLLSGIPDYLAVGSIDTLIILGAAMLLFVNGFIFGQVKGRLRQSIMLVLIVGSLLFAGAIGFKIFIILVALFSLVYFIASISRSKINREISSDVSSPVSHSSLLSLLTLALSLVLILGGNTFSSFLSNTFRVSNVDVRPNFATTLDLVGSAWKSNPILGVGPNKFSNLWDLHRPLAVNVTDFWNTDFTNGFSYLMTLVAEVGPLGTLAIFAFLVLFVIAGFRAIFNQNLDNTQRFIITSLFLTSFYFWLMACLYTVGIVVLGATFLFTGLAIASLLVFQISLKKEINLFGNSRLNFVSIFGLVVCLLFCISAEYFVWEKLIASHTFNKGEKIVQTGNLEGALSPLVSAALVSSSDAYWRGVANTYTGILQNKLATLDPKAQIDANTRTELQNYIASAILAAQNAIKVDNKNYLNYFVLGNVYESLARVGVTGALENGKLNYEEAKRLSPRNPGILLMLARLAVLEGNTKLAFRDIEESLALKSNFTDALFLKAQIEVANNNIEGAVKSVEDATLIDPLNSGLYFQLGLLKYNQRDWRGAAASFERAVTLVSNYANAKYFLGLSYSMLNRDSEAIQQFEDLVKTNPDNQEIKFILKNLKSGRSPFANAEPPVDDKPEKRDEPPIEE